MGLSRLVWLEVRCLWLKVRSEIEYRRTGVALREWRLNEEVGLLEDSVRSLAELRRRDLDHDEHRAKYAVSDRKRFEIAVHDLRMASRRMGVHLPTLDAAENGKDWQAIALARGELRTHRLSRLRAWVDLLIPVLSMLVALAALLKD